MDLLPSVPPLAVVLAVGHRPEWRLLRRGGTLRLEQAGQPPVEGTDMESRQTPYGTLIAARIDDRSSLTVRVTFGQCGGRGAPSASYIAEVQIGQRRLRGCFLMMPPGERPLLD